jgi:prepilin-type N-terminal cleavage/methylation domain-containing protein
MDSLMASRRGTRGFSLVELLVTLVVAGIIFAAMIPVFASALKKTSADNLRVTAGAIAQDRIEKIRQLPYGQIVAVSASPTVTPNLYNPSFANGQFATSYTPVGSTKTYKIGYTVDDTHRSYKQVTVTVDWVGSGPNYTTRMNTIVMDPLAMQVQSLDNPFPPNPLGYKLTVAFKNWTHVNVSPYGVTVTQVFTRPGTPTPVPTKTVTLAIKRPASAATPTVSWTALPGGMNVNYTVKCFSSHFTSTSPMFHLFSDSWMKFDTYPGGS